MTLYKKLTETNAEPQKRIQQKTKQGYGQLIPGKEAQAGARKEDGE